MTNSNLTIIFSSLGHAFMHMFAAFYFIIVLSIESDWELSYDALIKLWSLGALLIGLGAIPFGWLSDRWSRSSMMVIMFFGMGLSSIICGLSSSALGLFLGLSILGLACSIYHPVGIAWIVNSSKKKGRALGINGVFGGIGIGSGAFIAGFLLKFFSWNFTFILPGLMSVLIGFLLLFLILFDKISFKNTKSEFIHEKNSTNNFIIISIIMLCAIFGLGLTFQIMQTSLPKIFDIRLNNYSTFKIGSTIGVIYFISGLMNFIGGILADKYSLKKIYIYGLACQAPCFFAIAYFSGLPLILACLAAAMFNSSILPAENILLSKFTPPKHHGLIYGCKFIIAFGSGPLAVFFVAQIYKLTLEFTILFIFSSVLMLLIFFLTLFLPYKHNNLKISN
jgi:MFS family permease|tara:strand:- start:23 stop:1201 length:1179 start_codon:yes stop_codon:yes gene_type:complete